MAEDTAPARRQVEQPSAEDRLIGVEEARHILGCSRQSIHNWVSEGKLDGEYQNLSGRRVLLVMLGSCHRFKAELARAKYARTPDTSKDSEHSAELKREARFSLEMAEFDEKVSRDAHTRAVEEQTKALQEMSRKLDRLGRIESILSRILERMPRPGSGFDWLLWGPIVVATICAVAEKLGVQMPRASESESSSNTDETTSGADR